MKRNLSLNRLGILLLILCAAVALSGRVKAKSDQHLALRAERDSVKERAIKGARISPDLSEQVGAAPKDEARSRIVLQIKGQVSDSLNVFLKRSDVHSKKELKRFNSKVIEMPSSLVGKLSDFPEVSYISLDREVKSLGHVSATTGADIVRQQIIGNGITGLDGTGIGIAVLDSSIYNSHTSFLGNDGNNRLVLHRDFTGEGMNTDDPYGHGTHVAALVAGNNRIAAAAYTGIAPNAKLINLRVLNREGVGTVSGLLAALEWIMDNRAAYNIRVVNMSLGTAAVDSYRNDPLCKAVRRLVDAGVVVVAAAGNHGKNDFNQKVYGHIHSPGNEPSAITVGAANTFGTNRRNDDVVATYSSRGPTRSYWTDAAGTKHYDNLIKPDIVAPGNKLISAEAKHNLLITQNPQLSASLTNNDDAKMMYLSGTSMAAPVVAGAAALLLQANPRLTPNMVKTILQYTAQPLAGYNMFEQGAGALNIEGAVRLAKSMRADLTAATRLGAPLLSTNTLPAGQTTIAGHKFLWSQGVILASTFATGTDLIAKYQKIYAIGVAMSDGVITSDGVSLGDLTMLTDGVLLGNDVLTSTGVAMSDGIIFLPINMLLYDGVAMSDGDALGDGLLISDSKLLENRVLKQSAVLQAYSVLVHGDETAAMR